MNRTKQALCDNLNHRRAIASVRHCPTCGVLMNRHLVAGPCTDLNHATARRERMAFCFRCGLQLMTPD